MLQGGRLWLRLAHVWLLLGALASIGFFALADMAEDQHVPRMDVVVRAYIQSERGVGLERPMRALSQGGSAYGLVPLGTLVLLLTWPRDRRLALFVPCVMPGAILLEGVSKWAVSRPRPNLAAYGFPSGHTLASTVFFGALMYVLWQVLPRGLWRVVGTAAGVLAIMGVAYSRLYLDAHWLTDVVGGFLEGAAYVAVAIVAFERWGRPRPRTAPVGSPPWLA